MDFRNFPLLTSIFRRDHRTEYPLGDFNDHSFLIGGHFPRLYTNDAGNHIQQRLPFRMRYNGAQDFSWPTFRGQRQPFEAFATRNSDGLPLRLRLMDIDPAGRGARDPFYTLQPDRLLGRTQFIDALDEERPSRTSIERGREEPLPSLDFFEDEYHRNRQRRPETRRATLSPRSCYTSYRYGNSRAQERQFRNIGRRLSAPGADRYTDWNPRLEGQKGNALPFGKAMQWLHGALLEAENFYQNFYNDYNREVQSIKYASAEILKTLWVSKLSGKGAPAGEQDRSQDKKLGGKWEEEFVEKKKRLCEAMEAALIADLRSGEQDSPEGTTLEARKRLQEKVDIACHHVLDLLDSTMKASENCRALLGELKLLKDLVDPKKNKVLFEGGDGGNVGGSGGQDNQGWNDDGGGWNNDEQQSSDWDIQNQF